MRIPGQVKMALPHFEWALAEAEEVTTPDRHKFIAEAHKEKGFYYRNTGQWREADLSYKHARDTISATLSAQSSREDRDEMASIQTNWAYVKGLDGDYLEGQELIESAISFRHRIETTRLRASPGACAGRSTGTRADSREPGPLTRWPSSFFRDAVTGTGSG